MRRTVSERTEQRGEHVADSPAPGSPFPTTERDQANTSVCTPLANAKAIGWTPAELNDSAHDGALEPLTPVGFQGHPNRHAGMLGRREQTDQPRSIIYRWVDEHTLLSQVSSLRAP
jgi:hypothetical protein